MRQNEDRDQSLPDGAPRTAAAQHPPKQSKSVQTISIKTRLMKRKKPWDRERAQVLQQTRERLDLPDEPSFLPASRDPAPLQGLAQPKTQQSHSCHKPEKKKSIEKKRRTLSSFCLGLSDALFLESALDFLVKWLQNAAIAQLLVAVLCEHHQERVCILRLSENLCRIPESRARQSNKQHTTARKVPLLVLVVARLHVHALHVLHQRTQLSDAAPLRIPVRREGNLTRAQNKQKTKKTKKTNKTNKQTKQTNKQNKQTNSRLRTHLNLVRRLELGDFGAIPKSVFIVLSFHLLQKKKKKKKKKKSKKKFKKIEQMFVLLCLVSDLSDVDAEGVAASEVLHVDGGARSLAAGRRSCLGQVGVGRGAAAAAKPGPQIGGAALQSRRRRRAAVWRCSALLRRAAAALQRQLLTPVAPLLSTNTTHTQHKEKKKKKNSFFLATTHSLSLLLLPKNNHHTTTLPLTCLQKK
jgi:hypothetical protein